MTPTSSSTSRKIAGPLLVLIPLILALIPAYSLILDPDYTYAVAYIFGFSAALILLTSFIALGRLTLSQALLIYIGSFLAPIIVMLLSAIIPRDVYQIVDFQSDALDITAAFTFVSFSVWIVISCVFILTFRRRLPVLFVPMISLAAIITPLIACVFTLDENGFPNQQPDQARAALLYAVYSVPTAVLGLLLWFYADVVRNVPSMPIEYQPETGNDSAT